MVSYCQNCNCELGEETESCPACGYSPADRTIENSNRSEKNTQRNDQYMGTALTAAFLFGAIWAIVSVHEGINFIKQGIIYGTSSSLISTDIYHDLAQINLVSGPLLLISGIFVILSCIYIFQLQNYRKASNYYLIGFVLAIVSGVAYVIQYYNFTSGLITVPQLLVLGYSIIFGIIGIIFFIFIRTEKNRFNS